MTYPGSLNNSYDQSHVQTTEFTLGDAFAAERARSEAAIFAGHHVGGGKGSLVERMVNASVLRDKMTNDHIKALVSNVSAPVPQPQEP